MNSNNEQWAVVTGASSGIGRELALGLQQHGYRVIATARAQQDIDDLSRLGLTVIMLELADADSVGNAAEQILTLCNNNLYALVNNAAYGQRGAVEDISRNALEQQFAVNLFGTHQLTRAMLPALRHGEGGRIVNISSVLGLVAFPWQGAYNASKFALEGLTDTLRLELYRSNVGISLIEPGPIRSKFRNNALNKFSASINCTESIHAATYQRIRSYYAAGDHPTPFTGTPAHVLKRVVHALQSSRPKPRYYVTLPTYILATCRRLLPWRLLDRLLHYLGQQR